MTPPFLAAAAGAAGRRMGPEDCVGLAGGAEAAVA